MGFIDSMRGKGFAVETICAVLREQGVQVAARTYRSWSRLSPAARTVSDAVVVDAIRSSRIDEHGRPTPESLYGRRKTTALLRRRGLAVAHCTVDRLMREHGWNGLRRGRMHRTTIPAKDGARAGDLLNRDFRAGAPNRVWVADFTYVRTWAGFVYVSFVVDVFAQKIVGWHAMSSRPTDLVMVPLRMACWCQRRTGTDPVATDWD
ncbi:transposase InsO family protein [Cellulomonas uda]|uniref:IS3 family transposase n=2 Tax=Cellulomonas uda TaxID=1714 RepID=UPI00141BCC76|nr:IS3 family transposase [Cellulomonas uda]NII65389.1 transposase InsO family protein [Cellulomonas uda]